MEDADDDTCITADVNDIWQNFSEIEYHTWDVSVCGFGVRVIK
jgi:hypothetical protein